MQTSESANIPLAIVGIGCLFPKAAGPGFYWANVKHGVDCITAVPPTHWDPADYFDPDPKKPDMTYARRGGFLDPVDFDPMEFGIAPRDIEATDTTQLLGLVAAKQALADAGVLLANPEREVGGSDPVHPRPGGRGSPNVVDRNRVSVILGVTGTLELVIPLGARLGHPKWKRAMKEAGVPDELAEDAAQRIAESYVPWQENSFPGLLGNVVAGRIANKLDFGGTNCVVDAACASSLSAVHLAALELQTGKADIVVTGGADTFNDIFMYMCFSKTPALSPSGDAKPFDADGDGTILGEGLGVVVLKRLSDAERDGDTIYAVIRGIGSSSDGKGNAIYAPSAAGQRKCLLNAYAAAGVTPDTIELVEAHGTGTRVGDTVEITALTEVYTSDARSEIDDLRLKNGREDGPAGNRQSSISNRKSRPWCAIGSVKSQVGHTKAAAGAASLIKAALALYNKVLPPTAKVTRPIEPLRSPDSPFYVNTRMRPWLPRPEHPRRAGLSAFGFGGSNFHAVLEEYRPHKSVPDWDGSVELVTLAADTPEQLLGELEKLEAAVAGWEGEAPAEPPTAFGARQEPRPPKEAAWSSFARRAEASRSSFRPDAAYRLAFAAHRELTDLPKLLAGARARLRSDPAAASWHTPEGAHYGAGPAPGLLAVLFPGQGSQSVGMLRELACLFPEMLDTLADANAAVAAHSRVHTDARRLSDRIYPPTSFDPERQKADDRDLRDTRNAQPAIGALSYGLWKVLRDRFGLAADAFAGHSYGELVALSAAGRFAPSDLFTLSWVRGELMARDREGDRGAMLAVLAPRADIERVIAEQSLNLVVANHNAPKQTVLSGGTAEVERAEKVLAAAGLNSSRLPVAAAFHSPYVSDAAAPFRAALDGVNFAAGQVPVFANTTAAEYPADPAAAKDLLANQLAKPVAFVDQVRAMAAAGVRTFVEVGPGSVLMRLAESILAETPEIKAEAFALDASGGKRPGVLDLGGAVARLVARGYAVRTAAWEEGGQCRPARVARKPGLTVRLSGANYTAPRAKRPPRPALNGQHVPTPAPTTRPNATAARPAAARVPLMSDAANTPHPAEPSSLAQALLMTQQSLLALQRMQEHTAQLHRQFLESQEAAQRTLQALVDQQQALILSGLGAGVTLPAVPVPLQVAEPAPPRPAADTAPVPAPAPVPTPAPAPPRPVAKPGVNRVGETLLAVVAEKTGYPVESLDLKLSLDADLGVDSIKRVEILSALRERLPESPEVKPEHLGTLHTLQDVADFLAADDLARTVPVTADQLAQIARSAVRPAPKATSTDTAAALLSVVAEKTGYPVESLDLKLSLDADLGVDSIKRVEILSALRERLPESPEVKPEHLGTLHTLQDVADFLAGRSAQLESPPTAKIPVLPVESFVPDIPTAASPETVPQPAAASPPELSPADTEQVSKIHPVTSLPQSTRPTAEGNLGGTIPQLRSRATPVNTLETLRQPATAVLTDRIDRSILQVVDLDPNTPRARVPLPAGGEVWVVGEAGGLALQVAERLGRKGFKAQVMDWSGAGSAKPAGLLAAVVLIAPVRPGPDSGLNRLAVEWLQQAGPKLRQTGRAGAAVLATVARLDGAFGLGELTPKADPTAGGLAGIVKTARHEWPELTYKAIDLSPAFTNTDAAAALVVEEVLTAGPLEVGIAPTHRCTLELARAVRRTSSQLINLTPKDVILVTGGARGVTAEAAVALAESFGPTMILTGRTPPPSGPEPEWLTGLSAEADIKKAIAARLGPDAGPPQIREQYEKVANQREIRRTIRRIEEAGAKAVYFPVDAADRKAVADMLEQVRSKYGPVTAVVHGAGVLADRRIEDLTAADFDRVYSTKVEGLQNLLERLARDDLKALVVFSSTTGRFGRIGQLAYAVANEVLNKTAQVESRRRPGCRVVAVNWGPWEGGMVTPGLRRQFESEGVGLIPLHEGSLFMVQELNAAGKAVEVIAIGKHRPGGSGVAPAPGVSTPASVPGLIAGSGVQPAVGSGVVSPPHPAPAVDLIPAFERTIAVESHPVLRSHVLDGRAVLPMALHLELLAHAALHGHPGLVFHGFNDLRITQGITIDATGSAPIRALAGKAVKHDKLFLVPVELRGKRRDGREMVKSRAEIVLVAALPKAPPADRPPQVRPAPFTPEQAYREFLFHGPDLHTIERIDGASETAFMATANTAPPPAEWFQYPLRSSWVSDPLVLDAAFQMMILWGVAQHHTESLPSYAGRYRQFRRSFPPGAVTVVIRVTRDNGTFARADIDFLDADGQVIAQMQDYESMMEKSLHQAFRRNQLGMAKA